MYFSSHRTGARHCRHFEWRFGERFCRGKSAEPRSDKDHARTLDRDIGGHDGSPEPGLRYAILPSDRVLIIRTHPRTHAPTCSMPGLRDARGSRSAASQPGPSDLITSRQKTGRCAVPITRLQSPRWAFVGQHTEIGLVQLRRQRSHKEGCAPGGAHEPASSP